MVFSLSVSPYSHLGAMVTPTCIWQPSRLFLGFDRTSSMSNVKPDDEVIELLYDAEIAIPRLTESSVAASDAM